MCSLVAGATAAASPLTISIRHLAGVSASSRVAIDLVDGDGPSNVAALTGFTTDGAMSLPITIGGASGSMAGGFTLRDTAFLSDVSILLTGADSFVFSFTPSHVPPASGGFPDSLSVFLLDPITRLPRFATTDPSGANALLSFFFTGVGDGSWQVYSAPDVGVSAVWSVVAASATAVPEPSTLMLLGLGLILVGRRRRVAMWLGRPATSALVVLLACASASEGADVMSSVAIGRSGFILNRATSTFDTVVTLQNTSEIPVSAPMHLAIASVSPASVYLYNAAGRDEAKHQYVQVPIAGGVLFPGQSTTATLRFLVPNSQGIRNVTFALDGVPMPIDAAATIVVSAFHVTGPDFNEQGPSVGSGFIVRVDEVIRGVTDANGQMTLRVPTGAKDVSVEHGPNYGGDESLDPPLTAAEIRPVRVLVDDGKEIAADATLRLEQVQRFVLERNLPRLVARFFSNEQPVRLSSVQYVDIDGVGDATALNDATSLNADGSVAIAAPQFYQLLAGKTGKLKLVVSAQDSAGNIFEGEAPFYFADYAVRVQLVAPPSTPDIPLGGVRVDAEVLNTDVVVTAETDASGLAVFPTLPAGSMTFIAQWPNQGTTYVGFGTVPITRSSLVLLTMRGPQDIMSGVKAIEVQALIAGLIPPDGDMRNAGLAFFLFSPCACLWSRRRVAGVAALVLLAPTSLYAEGPPSAYVSARGDAQNEQITQAATLRMPKGTRSITLAYNVFTAEYPSWVLKQSKYDDVWSVVVSGNTGVLFQINRQVNAQLSQSPTWRTDGSTGVIRENLDVSALTTDGAADLTVTVTSVNIGDSILPTTAQAWLEPETLIITRITRDELNARNAGEVYSVPRAGSANTDQRYFMLQVEKPSGATLTDVTVDLRSPEGSLMQTVVGRAPGQDGVATIAQSDRSATLRVRGTVMNPTSTVGGVPPPTRDLVFRFAVNGQSSTGNPLKGEKDIDALRALWRMPDGFPRYGERDRGGDDWAARGTYTWMAANRALLSEIDDISGEHGRYIRHPRSHAYGTDIDMFHFYRFDGAASGHDNYSRLRDAVVAAFGVLSPDGKPLPNPPPVALSAQSNVLAWLRASRTGLMNLANNTGVERVIYCLGLASGGLPGGWCRSLLTQGTVTHTVVVPGQPSRTRTLTFAGVYSNAKLLTQDDHNHHIHVQLNKTAIGE